MNLLLFIMCGVGAWVRPGNRFVSWVCARGVDVQWDQGQKLCFSVCLVSFLHWYVFLFPSWDWRQMKSREWYRKALKLTCTRSGSKWNQSVSEVNFKWDRKEHEFKSSRNRNQLEVKPKCNRDIEVTSSWSRSSEVEVIPKWSLCEVGVKTEGKWSGVAEKLKWNQFISNLKNMI